MITGKQTGAVTDMKKESELFEIVIETVTALAILIYIGLQIYYAYTYESSITVVLYHFLPVLFLYIGMTMLQIFPEYLNGIKSEPLKGMVRVYAVHMVRINKMFLIIGMLLPSIADALGIRMNPAYSLLLMGCVLGTIVYYLYKIYQYNKKQGGK